MVLVNYNCADNSFFVVLTLFNHYYCIIFSKTGSVYQKSLVNQKTIHFYNLQLQSYNFLICRFFQQTFQIEGIFQPILVTFALAFPF